MLRLACPSVVGRDHELAVLHGALDDLEHHGRGQLIVLQGEAGVGKTRLADELATAAHHRQVVVLSGRAVETDTPVPFRPLCEALVGYFRNAEDGRDAAQEAFRPTLAQLVPHWRRAADELYRASPVELAEALLRLLSTIGRPAGCVLILEDLHWADADTAAVVEYIGDNVASLPIVCLITLRPDTASPADRAVGALESGRHAQVIELHRMDPSTVVEIAQLCLGTGALSPEIEQMVLRFSDGLPFLVEELLAVAIGDGFVAPERFTDIVRQRLAGLPRSSADVLAVAAVAASHFSVDLLTVLSGRPVDAVIATLREGEAAHLVAADPADPAWFGFRHELTRAGILGQLLAAERLSIARRALARLESQDPDLSGETCEVAASLAGIAGDRSRAADLLVLGARRAMAIGAFSSAESMLVKAVEYAGAASPARVEAGCLLIDVLTQIGDVERALEVGRGLQDAGAHLAGGALDIAVARAAVAARRWDVANRALGTVRAEAIASDDAARLAETQAIEAMVAFEAGRTADAEAFAKSSLATAEQLDLHALACESLHVLGTCSRARGDVVDAEVRFDQMVDRATLHGLWTLRLRGSLEQASLDAWRALPSDRIVAVRDQAIGAGALVVAAHLDNVVAWMARDRWETDVADAAGERCAEAARRFKLGALEAMALSVRAIAAGQRGDRDQMEAYLAQASAADPDSPDIRALHSVAWVNLWLCHDDLARATTELENTTELLHTSSAPAPERGLRALVRTIAGDDVEAVLAELDDGPDATFAVNVAYRHYALAVAAGRQGDAEGADRHVVLAEANPLLAWVHQHTRRLIAQAATADRWGEPITWLHKGEAYFAARGFDQIAVACRRLLSEAGAPVPRRSRNDQVVPPDLRLLGVSARELQVLYGLADAHSTRQIAAALFISPKTVDRHVANLARKLGVAGRSALVAFATARHRAADGVVGPGESVV